MIFVIDVGNTNMTMGVFRGEKLAATFRIMTKTPRTSDEYGIMITQLLKSNGIKTSDIEGAIIASVVPDVMHSLTSAIIRYLKTKPLIASSDAIILDKCSNWFNLVKYIINTKIGNFNYVDIISY